MKSLEVVNDRAERAINLIQNYSGKVIKSEEGFQNLLQVSSIVNRAVKKSRKVTKMQLVDLNK